MRRLIYASGLLLALLASAQAGEVPTTEIENLNPSVLPDSYCLFLVVKNTDANRTDQDFCAVEWVKSGGPHGHIVYRVPVEISAGG